jgi:hypothetical protein
VVADQSPVNPGRDRIQSFRTAPPNAEFVSSNGNGHGSHGRGELREAPPLGERFDPHHASTGQLVTQAAAQLSALVRTELALGKAELMEKGKRLGMGAGLLATAGLLGLYTFGLLIALVAVILDRDWPAWLAVLVPLLALGTLCLLLAAFGISRLRSGAEAPTEATHSLRDDFESVKHAFQEGRHSR